jgi:hypothetical protein
MLEKLILVYPVQEGEREFYTQAGLDAENVLTRRIIAVRNVLEPLGGLRIEVERNGTSSLTHEEHERVSLDLPERFSSVEQHSFAPWTRLPESIKRKVIQFAALPPDKLIHPLLRAGAILETRTLVSLLHTSTEISRLTQDIVYREGTFMSCLRKDRGAMYAFFQKRTPEQLQKIGRYNINGLDHWVDRRLMRFLKSRCPNARDMESCFRETMGAHPCWDVAGSHEA